MVIQENTEERPRSAAPAVGLDVFEVCSAWGTASLRTTGPGSGVAGDRGKFH